MMKYDVLVLTGAKKFSLREGGGYIVPALTLTNYNF